ncbi:hypothetical protein RHGRI_009629 [Rhododendron griersonianum]|uniref:AtTam37 zinc finger domain-containing protein n=1 Tax=Rhododendron griersonianum TaxID=479676 RepID=A0AAV6KFG2_9ERIC|nr:hypothetical protein RHGRI_009629 [Rhododendron griersonianum]
MVKPWHHVALTSNFCFLTLAASAHTICRSRNSDVNTSVDVIGSEICPLTHDHHMKEKVANATSIVRRVYHTQRLGEGALQSGSYTLKRFIHSTSVHPIQLFSSGEKPTAETVAETIVGNRAELVHFPSSLDPHVRLTSKDCPNCVGSMKRDVGREDAAIDSEHGPRSTKLPRATLDSSVTNKTKKTAGVKAGVDEGRGGGDSAVSLLGFGAVSLSAGVIPGVIPGGGDSTVAGDGDTGEVDGDLAGVGDSTVAGDGDTGEVAGDLAGVGDSTVAGDGDTGEVAGDLAGVGASTVAGDGDTGEVAGVGDCIVAGDGDTGEVAGVGEFIVAGDGDPVDDPGVGDVAGVFPAGNGAVAGDFAGGEACVGEVAGV